MTSSSPLSRTAPSAPAATRHWLAIACLTAAVGVVLGAFGAHGLKSHFDATLDDPQEISRRLEIWETGVRYHLIHALGLLGLGILSLQMTSSAMRWARILLLAGIIVFSGCLYALTLTDVSVLGAIVPLGGVSFLVGWCLAAYAVLKHP